MTLGERIYALRTAKNLSQGDLAEQLDVSRQSVSKWETDTSVPDLDKLVKLCDLFEVSMDELVRGEKAKENESAETQVIIREVKAGAPVCAIVGAVLVLIGVLVFMLVRSTGLENLLFAVPFVLCGIICLTVKKHPAVWCVWVLFVIACVYVPLLLGTWIYAGVVLLIALAVTTTALGGIKKGENDETTL